MSAYRTPDQWQRPTPYEELGGGLRDPNRPDDSESQTAIISQTTRRSRRRSRSPDVVADPYEHIRGRLRGEALERQRAINASGKAAVLAAMEAAKKSDMPEGTSCEQPILPGLSYGAQLRVEWDEVEAEIKSRTIK